MATLRAVTVKIYSTIFANSIIRKGISQLSKRNEDSDRLIKILEEVIKKELSGEEQRLIKRIEELRQMTRRSQTEIFFDNLNKGVMENNVTLRTTIGKTALIGKSGSWALLLFKLIREFKPSTCLELGTSLGFSASYQATALKLNQKGRLITLEGNGTLCQLAKQHLEKLCLNNVEIVPGKFQDTLNVVLKENAPIDYAFIDGHHDKNATINYFRQIKPHLSQNAVLVFDDISWSDGMRKAWQIIRNDKDVKTHIDFCVVGICIVKRNDQNR